MKRNRDEAILAALVTCGSIRQAAKRAFCSESTVRNKLKDAEFLERYKATKQCFLAEACDAISARLTLAIDTLSDIVEDEKTPTTIKVSAADAPITGAGSTRVSSAAITKTIMPTAQRSANCQSCTKTNGS